MAIDWDGEVLAAVFDTFGETVTYLPATGGRIAISGIFDREYLDVTLQGDGTENATRRPVLGVRASSLPSPATQNDRVIVPSVGLTYIVNEVRPDGHGWMKLMLNVTAPAT